MYLKLLIILLTPLLFPLNAKASTRLELVVPESFEIVAGDLRVGYHRPCGAEYLGVAVRQAAGGPMAIGVLVRHQGMMCVSMSQREVVKVAHLDQLDRRKLAALRSDIRSRLHLNEIVSLRAVVENKKATVQAIYEPGCGEVVAAVLNDDVDGVLKVGVLEQRSKKPERCNEQKAGALRFVNLRPRTSLQPINIATQKPEKAYDLRLAKITKLSLTKENGLQANYLRRCNESPIGFVVSPQDDRLAQVKVGVLVARFYNRACNEGEAKFVQEFLDEKSILLDPRRGLQAMPASQRMGAFTLRSPLEVAEDPKGSFSSIDYLGDCDDRVIGGVYLSSAARQVAVSVLKHRSTKGCRQPTAKKRLLQPLSFAPPSQNGRIVPMKLEGFRYYL